MSISATCLNAHESAPSHTNFRRSVRKAPQVIDDSEVDMCGPVLLQSSFHRVILSVFVMHFCSFCVFSQCRSGATRSCGKLTRKRTACGRCPSPSGVHRSNCASFIYELKNCASVIYVLLAVVCLTRFQFLHQLYYRRRHPRRAICLHSSWPSACFNVRCSAVVWCCMLAFIVLLLPLKLVSNRRLQSMPFFHRVLPPHPPPSLHLAHAAIPAFSPSHLSSHGSAPYISWKA